MANSELMNSWARSEALLRQARAALPEHVERQFQAAPGQFEDFLAPNELGLALDTLQDVVDESVSVPAEVGDALTAAVRNMDRR